MPGGWLAMSRLPRSLLSTEASRFRWLDGCTDFVREEADPDTVIKGRQILRPQFLLQMLNASDSEAVAGGNR